MITHINTAEEFKDFIKDGLVIIDFFATWCGPCRMLTPVLEDIDQEYEGKLKIGKIDVDSLSDIAQMYNVFSM